MFKYEFSEVLTLNHGLCTNASLAKIRSDVKRDMFKTFSKFSGNYTCQLFRCGQLGKNIVKGKP